VLQSTRTIRNEDSGIVVQTDIQSTTENSVPNIIGHAVWIQGAYVAHFNRWHFFADKANEEQMEREAARKRHVTTIKHGSSVHTNKRVPGFIEIARTILKTTHNLLQRRPIALEYEKREVRGDKHDEKACDSGEVHRGVNNKVTDSVVLTRGNLTAASWPMVISSIRGGTQVSAGTSRVDSLDSFVDKCLLNLHKASSAWGVRQG
jgi:hypothetical protein